MVHLIWTGHTGSGVSSVHQDSAFDTARQEYSRFGKGPRTPLSKQALEAKEPRLERPKPGSQE